MTDYGVTENGFVLKPYEAILEEVQNRLKANLGDDIDLSDNSFLGQMAASLAYEIAGFWQVLEAVYTSAYLSTAAGDNLDAVSAVMGLTRTTAVAAIGTVTFSRSEAATVDIDIPLGTRVSNQDTSIIFATTEKATLAAGATSVNVPVDAKVPGANSNVAIGAITNMVDTIAGIETVTNVAATTLGADAESDAELRLRTRTYTPDAKATIAALTSILEAIDGVTDVLVTEDTSSHTVTAVLIGGADAAITEAIAATRPAGIPVTWSHATTVLIAVTATVSKKTGYTAATVLANITAALTDYFDGLNIADAVTYSSLVSAILSATGVDTLTALSATDGTTTINALGSSIPIASTKKATGGTNTVTVS